MGQALLANVVVGLLFVAFGVIMSRVVRKGVPTGSYFILNSVFLLVLLAAGDVRWSAISGAGQLGRLTFWMVLGNLVNNLGHLIMMYNMKTAHKGASWAIAQSSMILPFLASVCLWQDRPGLSGWGGLVAVVVGIALLSAVRREEGGGRINARWLALALLNFLCYGFAQSIMGYPSRWEGFEDVAHLRPVLSVASALLFFATLSIVRRESLSAKAVPMAFAAAVIAFFSTVLLYWTLDRMTALGVGGIVWPVAVGVCIAGFSLYSQVHLREKFGKFDVAGILGILIGLALLAVR